MRPGKGHVGEHVLFGAVHETGELGHFRSDLVSDIAPVGACSLGRVLGEGGGDEGGDDTPSALSGMRQGIAHEMNPAALPGGVEHLGDSRLDAFMGIRDSKLDAAKAPPSQLAQELGPDQSPRPRMCRSPCPAPRAVRRC